MTACYCGFRCRDKNQSQKQSLSCRINHASFGAFAERGNRVSVSGISMINASHIHMTIVLNISVCHVKYFGRGHGPAYKIAFPIAAVNMESANPMNKDQNLFQGTLYRR